MQVYSLTGRNLPQTIRERLKKQKPVVSNTNFRVNEQPQPQSTRPHVNTIFEDHHHKHSQYNERPDSGLGASMGSDGFPRSPDGFEATIPMSVAGASVFSATSPVVVALPKKSPRNSESETSMDTNLKQPIKSSVTVTQQYQVNNEPIKKDRRNSTEKQTVLVKQKVSRDSNGPIKTAVTSKQPITTTKTLTRSASDSNSGKTDKSKLGPPPKRGKNSAILARAAFWDNRIQQGQVQDEEVRDEFPELPVDSFKRYR